MHRLTERRLTGLLALLCAGEIALAGLSWHGLTPSGGGSVPRPSAQAPLAAGPATGLETDPLASFSAFVDRPLFLATRRPPPRAAASPRPGLADAKADGVVFGPYRFTGIAVTPRVRIAFVTEIKTGRSIALAEGETLGDWRCAEITPGSVTLERDGKRELIELHPRR